jgi:protein disulfide-isomerase
MKKQIAGALLLGLVIAFGCSRPPVREFADASLPLTNSTPIDLNAAITQAGAESKIVLLDFTGSDWCGPCMQLHKQVFAQPEFEAYAQSNLVFLAIDFPMKYRLPEETAATNNFLAEKFDVHGFPTLIALNGHGKEIWRRVGFVTGERPAEFISTLNALKSKAP